ncbi:MAG: hypothetical protein WC730_04255 [Patescibacteria group bacterium]|jgi:hypothetical protein
MENKNKIIKIVMIVAGVLIVGGGIYFATKKSPEEKIAQVETKVGDAVGDIAAAVPDMDFSMSPLPDLNVSALNVEVGGSNVGTIFSAPSVNTDFSLKTGSLDFKTPTVSSSDLNFTMPTIPTMPTVPTGAPSGSGGTQTTTPPPTTTAPPSGSTGGQPSVDCSQFASVPSCSMTGPGEAMCKQCYPNK